MRSSPALSETRFSLSFFLTTPAKKPRTECCCQPIAFMIASMVVPFGCRSIPRTVSCFDDATVGLTAAFLGAAALDTAGDWAGLRFPDEALMVPGRLAPRFAALDLDLLVAIWLSLMSTTASRAATDTSPTIQRGEQENRGLKLARSCSILMAHHETVRPAAWRWVDVASKRATTHALSGAEVERILSNLVALFAPRRASCDRDPNNRLDLNSGTLDRHVAQSGTRLTTINRRWKCAGWPSQAH